MDTIIEQLKQLANKVIKWFSSSKEPQDPSKTTYNQRAQTEYSRKLAAYISQNGTPTDKQDAILYAQAYQMQIMKNPSSTKSPPSKIFLFLLTTTHTLSLDM